jgi:hypothetical protein
MTPTGKQNRKHKAVGDQPKFLKEKMDQDSVMIGVPLRINLARRLFLLGCGRKVEVNHNQGEMTVDLLQIAILTFPRLQQQLVAIYLRQPILYGRYHRKRFKRLFQSLPKTPILASPNGCAMHQLIDSSRKKSKMFQKMCRVGGKRVVL